VIRVRCQERDRLPCKDLCLHFYLARREYSECCVNFSFGAGIQDDEFHAQSLRGLLRILYLGLKARARWIRKEAD
jgi:hypothetical protein